MITTIRLGLVYALMAPLCFSIMNVLAKYSTTNLPSVEVVLFRSLFSCIILIVLMNLKKESWQATNYTLLIMRGIFGALGLLGVFYTISKIKLADASVLLQLNPLFVALFAGYFLKEKVPKHFTLLIFTALIGAILIIRPSHSLTVSFPAMVGVASAICAAAAYTCVRQLAKYNSTNMIILFYMIVACLFSLPLTLYQFIMPTINEWVALIGIGVFSSIAQIFLTKAYQRENASTVALLSYSGILLHFLWGYILWGEKLDSATLIGAILIVISCALIMKRPLARP